MAHSYQEDWKAYRARRSKLMRLMTVQLLGFPVFGALVILIDAKLFSSTSVVIPAASMAVWVLWYFLTEARLRIFPCPRCGKNFFGGAFLSNPARILIRGARARLGRECWYCGLRKFADSQAGRSKGW